MGAAVIKKTDEVRKDKLLLDYIDDFIEGEYVNVWEEHMLKFRYATFVGWLGKGDTLVPQIRLPGRGSRILDLPDEWVIKKIPVEPVKEKRKKGNKK